MGALVVTPNGKEIAGAYREQYTPGHHAEQQAPKDQREDILRSAIVEPCTVRGEQSPCSSRLIKARVAEVVIGM